MSTQGQNEEAQGRLALLRDAMVYEKGLYKYVSSKKDKEKCRYLSEWGEQQWRAWEKSCCL